MAFASRFSKPNLLARIVKYIYIESYRVLSEASFLNPVADGSVPGARAKWSAYSLLSTPENAGTQSLSVKAIPSMVISSSFLPVQFLLSIEMNHDGMLIYYV
jgi:hypothetical protein